MIRAFALKGGTLKELKPDKRTLGQLCKSRTKCWIDLEAPTKDEIELVTKVFRLHPLVSEDLRTHSTRTKVEDYSSYLFLVTYGLFNDKGINSHEFDFVLGKRYIISSHHVKAPDYRKLMDKPEIVRDKLKRGPDLLMHHLVDILVDNYTPVLEKLEDIVEDLEEEAARNPEPKISSQILETKRKIIMIKKVTFALREHAALLARGEHVYISNYARAYFRDLHDHTIRAADQVDSYREMIAGAHEAYMSALSNRMNEIMKVLSIIATIMLPLSFLTGLYGMNFRVMPGLGNPYGFWIMVGAMVALTTLMLGYFRSRKWM